MSPHAAVILVAIAAPVLLFVWRAVFRPWAACRWCGGRSRVGSGGRWRNCSHCGGSGRRMTLSARIVRGQGPGWGR